jgi:hypothetical protein
MQVLSVTVIPQASRNSVQAMGSDAYKVHVTASAFKGKANKEMLKHLARHLGVPASRLLISRGDRTNDKTVILLQE